MSRKQRMNSYLNYFHKEIISLDALSNFPAGYVQYYVCIAVLERICVQACGALYVSFLNKVQLRHTLQGAQICLSTDY